MADESLSEDEINALLSGVDDTLGDSEPSPAGESSSSIGDSFSTETSSQPNLNLNAIKPVIEKTLTDQTNHFSKTYQKNIQLTLDEVKTVSEDEITTSLPFPVVVVLNEAGGVLLSNKDASYLLGASTGEPTDQIDETNKEALQNVLNPSNKEASETLNANNIQANLNVQKILLTTSPADMGIEKGSYVLAKCSLKTEESAESYYYQFYAAKVFASFTPATPFTTKPTPMEPASIDAVTDDPFGGDTDLDSLLPSGDSPDVKSAEFMPLSGTSDDGSETNGNITLLLDVPMEVTVELGRSTKSIKEILSLGEGSIIELDKLAGEPVDLLVNRKLIAKGEVVVIDENFGVRVTEIVSPKGRIDAVE